MNMFEFMSRSSILWLWDKYLVRSKSHTLLFEAVAYLSVLQGDGDIDQYFAVLAYSASSFSLSVAPGSPSLERPEYWFDQYESTRESIPAWVRDFLFSSFFFSSCFFVALLRGVDRDTPPTRDNSASSLLSLLLVESLLLVPLALVVGVRAASTSCSSPMFILASRSTQANPRFVGDLEACS